MLEEINNLFELALSIFKSINLVKFNFASHFIIDRFHFGLRHNIFSHNFIAQVSTCCSDKQISWIKAFLLFDTREYNFWLFSFFETKNKFFVCFFLKQNGKLLEKREDAVLRKHGGICLEIIIAAR